MFREGRSFATRHLVLHVFPRAGAREPSEREAAGPAPGADGPDARPRLGVSVGRRVGGAVERNRVKRLLREAFWSIAPELPVDHDFVLVARPEAAELARRDGEPGFEAALRELLTRSGLAATRAAGE